MTKGLHLKVWSEHPQLAVRGTKHAKKKKQKTIQASIYCQRQADKLMAP